MRAAVLRGLSWLLTLPGLAMAGNLQVGACTIDGVSVLTNEVVLRLAGHDPARLPEMVDCIVIGQALERGLREAGALLAKVYVEPSPDPGRMRLRAIEGVLAPDGIALGSSGKRLAPLVVLGQLSAALEPGRTLRAASVERAILLTNDLPGVAGSSSQIFPGERVGEARFEISLVDGPVIDGQATLDNFGSGYTGRNRLGASARLNSLLGLGDRFAAGAVVSDRGTAYGYLDASLPAGPHGTRVGLGVDALRYRTNEGDGLRGHNRQIHMAVSHPFVRSRTANLAGELQLGRMSQVDRSDTSTVADRVVDALALTLRGERSDGPADGGVTAFQLRGVVGRLSLDGYVPYQALDEATARTAGHFQRLAWQASRTQPLAPGTQLFAELAGQLASKPLDGSQAIAFGGPDDFAGYAAGELLGDRGARLRVAWRHDLAWSAGGGRPQLSVHYDVGRLETHAQKVQGGFVVPGIVQRSFTVQSAGLALGQTWSAVQWQGVVGWRVNNRIPDELLEPGSRHGPRAWLQATYRF